MLNLVCDDCVTMMTFCHVMHDITGNTTILFTSNLYNLIILYAEGELNIGEYLQRLCQCKYSVLLTECGTINCFSIISRGEYQEL